MGDDLSGVVSGVSNAFLFLSFLLISLHSTQSPFHICTMGFLGERFLETIVRLDAEDVISLKICLEAPTFVPNPTDDLGVKNRVKVLGVTVAFFLVLPLLVPSGWLDDGIGGDSTEGGSGSVVGLALRLAD